MKSAQKLGEDTFLTQMDVIYMYKRLGHTLAGTKECSFWEEGKV